MSYILLGVEDIASVYLDIWNDLPTNKIVGYVFSNDVLKRDGRSKTRNDEACSPRRATKSSTSASSGRLRRSF